MSDQTDAAQRRVPERSNNLAVASSLGNAALSTIVNLVRTGSANTRPALITQTGFGRKIVTQRVAEALALGLLREGDLAPSEGGRQARTIQLNADRAHLLVAFVGASEFTVGITDLNGVLLATTHRDWPITEGPEATMRQVSTEFNSLRQQFTGAVWGIAVGLPGPVEFARGRLVAPPIMPGWNEFSARAWLRDEFDAPVWVDNDVNLMALGEWSAMPERRDLLFIKMGTGIGAGILVDGRLVRGQHGGAGDIGHIRVTDDPAFVCRCGKVGCLESVAGGWALLEQAMRRLDESPRLAAVVAAQGTLALGDLGAAATAGDPLARELIDTDVRAVAEVTAGVVNSFNPGDVVVGGGVLRVEPGVVDRFAEVIRSRVTDIAQRDLRIREASLNQLEGVVGGANLAVNALFSDAALQRWVGDGTPLGHAAALQRMH